MVQLAYTERPYDNNSEDILDTIKFITILYIPTEINTVHNSDDIDGLDFINTRPQ